MTVVVIYKAPAAIPSVAGSRVAGSRVAVPHFPIESWPKSNNVSISYNEW